MKPYLSYVIVMLSLAISQVIHAHGENDKTRFVAISGTDTGNCDNRFRPCRSIAYAASQANKGDKVLVAAGRYPVTNEETLFYLISELIAVYGGYSQADHYQVQNPSAYDTVLSGVPVTFASQLSEQGFNIIADGKKDVATNVTERITRTVTQLATRHNASDCIDGMAEGFSCQNIALLAHIPLTDFPTDSNSANDIWGHVDLNTMKEYAIIGLRQGVAVVEVTNPESPQIVGTIDGAPTAWRDIKVYQYFNNATNTWRAYAYISADEISEGVRIIDLNRLPESISEIDPLMDDTRAHNIYISHTDPGLNISLPDGVSQLHVAGSENYNGAWRSYRLTSPSKPTASYTSATGLREDYAHDITGFSTGATRAQRDCMGSSSSSCNVIIDFNEQSVRIWDHSNPDIAHQISEVTYPNIAYTHSGWPSENTQYLFVHDEMDESSLSLNTTVHVFDMSNLTNPTLVATWEGDSQATDHNGFAKGNRYYMSNYERGLTVLDISDPTAPEQIGFFDTFPTSDNASFNGAWGVYPFLPSGIILVSDIQGGLFILRDDTVANANAKVGFAVKDVTVQPGESADFTVQREGSSNINVGYRILYGSANNTDITASDSILNWNSPADPDQTITVSINENDDNEYIETFFIKLVTPSTGDVKRGAGLITVRIDSDKGNQGVANFIDDSFEVAETISLYNINVARVGGTQGSLRVQYEISAGTASSGDFQPQSGELRWEDGEDQDKLIPITVFDDDIDEDAETVIITLTGSQDNPVGDIATATLIIKDNESNQPPQVNAGANQTVSAGAQVNLTASASDPENDALRYSWQQSEGEVISLSQTDSLTPFFVAPQTATTIVLTLTVTDDLGASASDSVTITVSASNDNGDGDNIDEPATDNNGGGGGSLGVVMILLLCSRLFATFNLTRSKKGEAPPIRIFKSHS